MVKHGGGTVVGLNKAYKGLTEGKEDVFCLS